MNLKYVCFLLLSFVFTSSCKKQNDNVFLANETTQGFDGYGYTDTLSLLTSTVREDSLKTDSLSHNLVGVLNDPSFGKYSAISYFQFRLPQLGNVISNQKLDSAVLFVQFTSSTAYYGDPNYNMDVSIHEVNENMGYNVNYSNQSYQYDNTPIGNYTGRFNMTDSMPYMDLGDKKKAAPGFSVKLSSTFAQKLFNANATQLASQQNFLSLFKGIAIVPNSNPGSGQGLIAALNMKGTYSRIRVYYNDTMQSDFQVVTDSRRFSKYSIEDQPAFITNQKSFKGKVNFDTTYLQAMTGAKTFIKIPYLFSLIQNKNKRVTVGKAEIIIRPQAGSYTSPFTLPKRLLLLQPDETTGMNASIEDLLEPNYDGNYNSVANEYRFNITRHIQKLFIDYQSKGINNDRGLYLIIPLDEPIAPSRMVIDARKKIKDAGIEFKIVFTEL